MEQFIQNTQQLLNFRLTDAQVEAFKIFEEQLLIWNEKFNLTAIRDVEQIRNKHFLDSLTCMLAWKDNWPRSLIDVGTGAGFPGIPLKIIQPKMKLTLVESVGKKTRFCQHIVDVLNLDDVTVLQDRAEVLGNDLNHREKYDWAVARAVANLPTLTEYLMPLVKLGGGVIALKGESGPAEAQKANHAIHVLGGSLKQLLKLTIPGVVEERYLVVINKTHQTPKMFPRRTGIPAKNPLL